MSSDRFESTWVPRVGASAAALLKKRALLAISGPFLIVAIWIAAITLPSASYYAVVLPGTATYLVAYLWLLRNLNRRIAAALSAHLGIAISTWSIPTVRSAARFDRAIEARKGARVPHERSFLGGFIKIPRP